MQSRGIVFALVVLIVGAGGFLLLQTTSVTPGGVRVGQTPVAAAACREDDCLPDFKVRTVTGAEISREELRGKTVLVNFWATWCGPCVKEIPALEAAFKRFGGDGFVVLGIAVDGTDESIRTFLQQHGASYPVVRATPTIDRLFGRPALLPTSYLYGADGHLQQTWQRALDEGDLTRAASR